MVLARQREEEAWKSVRLCRRGEISLWKSTLWIFLERCQAQDDAREVEASTGRPRADTTTARFPEDLGAKASNFGWLLFKAPEPALAAIYRILG